jgi:ATP-dependent Clp protease ATP-binding subunit ClpC
LIEAEKIAKNIFKHDFICTEHFVLAVLNEHTRASNILKKYGLTFEQSKEKLHEMILSTQPMQDQDGHAFAGVNKNQQKRGKTPVMESFATDLTELAQQGKLPPIIGRQKEIERIVQILGRKTKNNPALLGMPGTGKTALVEGLAQLMVKENPPEWLKNKRLCMIDLGAIVAGTKYRGQFEERIKALIQEVKNDDSIILVIDELHTINGAGASEGALDAANMFKQPLARGELRLIGITTLEEYRKHIEKDKALERRFQPVMVKQPTIPETLDILRGVKKGYEEHHGVVYDDEAIEAAVHFADKYITDRQMPDKAIDVIDETGSRVKMRFMRLEVVDKLEQELRKIESDMEPHIKKNEFEAANDLLENYKKIEDKIKEVKDEWVNDSKNKKISVNRRNIAEVVSTMTGIPINKIDTPSERDRLKSIQAELAKRIVAQGEAIETVGKAVMRGLQGLKEYNKPIGSFLFLGSTGTGKTELAKVLSEYLFNDDDAFFSIDMSEFGEQHEVAKFYGAPAGYVGHDESGVFEKVRKKPFCVILFDEIEKAHPRVLNVLLQILDEGRLTDSHHNVISFKNTIIIMTSNLGVSGINKKGLGFDMDNTEEGDYQDYKNKIIEKAKKTLKPEFVNRLDEVVVFRKLNKENCSDIIDIIIKLHNESFLKDKNVNLTITKSLKEKLVHEGFSEEYGGREIKRAIKKNVYDPMSEYLLNLTNVDLERDKISVIADLSDDRTIFTYCNGNGKSKSKKMETSNGKK